MVLESYFIIAYNSIGSLVIAYDVLKDNTPRIPLNMAVTPEGNLNGKLTYRDNKSEPKQETRKRSLFKD